MTVIAQNATPPLRPRAVGGKMAVSCHKPREWLIRAWCPRWHEPQRLVGWVLHHVGRFDLDALEWWGYTYKGVPSYSDDRRTMRSGLTIQRFVPEVSSWMVEAQERGRVGLTYGAPEPLAIPDPGFVR